MQPSILVTLVLFTAFYLLHTQLGLSLIAAFLIVISTVLLFLSILILSLMLFIKDEDQFVAEIRAEMKRATDELVKFFKEITGRGK